MEIKLQPPAEKLSRKDIPYLLGLFSLGLFLFLFYTWAMPLIDPDEPRYASTARDMVLNGNWIVPHFNGVPPINKPPLTPIVGIPKNKKKKEKTGEEKKKQQNKGET